MNRKKMFFGLLLTLSIMSSCNEASKPTSNDADSQAEAQVQKVIDSLGLVYVEEGAETVVTYAEVNAAQQAWCDALVQIGKLKEEGGDYKAFASEVLSSAYNYDSGKVFFKPTLTFGDQTFRNDKKGALAYFIGGDPDYPNDKGFALKPWVKARSFTMLSMFRRK